MLIYFLHFLADTLIYSVLLVGGHPNMKIQSKYLLLGLLAVSLASCNGGYSGYGGYGGYYNPKGNQNSYGTQASYATPDEHYTPDVVENPFVEVKDGSRTSNVSLTSTSFAYTTLESALITHLNEFLLELGNGFAFVARQKRFDMDGRNFYVDLVLYNYKLKCFVLIDLKRGDLTHQDIGQMQMYVNYYTRELMEPDDNPPIGIVLCADKSDTLVRYTLPLDNKQIYASKYMLYLPKEEELQNEINKQIELFEEMKEQ